MKWTELSIHTTQDAVEPISYILHEAGASGVVIEDPQDLLKVWDTSMGELYELNPEDYPKEGVIVKAYLSENSSLPKLIEEIKQNINQLTEYNIDLGKNDVKVSEVNEEDWATSWKKYYKPVKISEKITIVPTWEEYEPANSDEVIIELDPGMAFGTGTHPTTVMCMQALEKYVKEGDQIFDVGTGSGVLSIAAAKLGAGTIHAYDLDDVAVTSARANVKLNHADDKIKVAQNNLLLNVTDEADIIVGNLLAEIILKFVDDAYELVKTGGYFITSGIIKQKAEEVRSSLIDSGFSIEETIQMEDWVAIVAKK